LVSSSYVLVAQLVSLVGV